MAFNVGIYIKPRYLTNMQQEKINQNGCQNPDSSSLTNEKDHHYFLNSADVCW